MKDKNARGNGMILDKNAKSASKDLPAFLNPPEGAKAYHGFPLIKKINSDGFTYGAITDYLQKDSGDYCSWGDGFVEGHDGSRAGIVWEKGGKFSHSEVIAFEKNRWGVYHFTISFKIKNDSNMKKAFLLMLSILKRYYKLKNEK